MKKIVVFGATGNVGSYFVKYASENMDNFKIIPSGKRDTATVFRNLRGVNSYISVDITKEDEFSRLPQEDVYAVVHLASALPAYMEGYHPEEYIKTIITGTLNILEYCRKTHVDRILYSTTCFDVMGYPIGTLIKPDMKPKFSYTGDHAVYVICKNTALELLKMYHQQYKLKTFAFRFPSIYSYSPNHYVYIDGIRTIRPVYKLIQNAIEGKPLEIWGDPDYARDMVHVYDVSQMLCKAIINTNLEEGFYNCGTGKPVTLMEQMEAIRNVFCPPDKQSEIICLKEKPTGGGILMDIQNAKDELGYSPLYDVHDIFEDFRKEMEINRFAELRI